MSKLLIRPDVFENRIDNFGFEFLSFEARNLEQGKSYGGETGANELAIVVLGGTCSVKSSAREYLPHGYR